MQFVIIDGDDKATIADLDCATVDTLRPLFYSGARVIPIAASPDSQPAPEQAPTAVLTVKQTIAGSIRQWFNEHPHETFKTREFIAVNKCKRKAVDVALSCFRKQGKVRRVRPGMYRAIIPATNGIAHPEQ